MMRLLTVCKKLHVREEGLVAFSRGLWRLATATGHQVGPSGNYIVAVGISVGDDHQPN